MASVPLTPNRVAAWLIGVPCSQVAVGWVATWTQSSWWLWTLAMALVALIILTVPGGFFSTPGPAGRALSALLMTAYVALAPVLLATTALVPSLLAITLLWAAATTVTWRSLRTRFHVGEVALCSAGLLAGVAVLLLGMSFLRGGNDTLAGVALLPGGAAGLLLGASLLRGRDGIGVALLLIFAAVLLSGAAVLLLGVAAFWRGGDALFVVALLLSVAGFLLLGGSGALFGVALLLSGAATLLGGVSFWRGGDMLIGVAFLLVGVAFLLSGAVVLWLLWRRGSSVLAGLMRWFIRKDSDVLRGTDVSGEEPRADPQGSSKGRGPGVKPQ